MTWYTTGTISLTNGAAAVVGASTQWVDTGTLNPGDMLLAPDGKLYQILSIQSNTGLTLSSNYLGSTAAAQPYAIIPIGLLPSALAAQVKTVLTTANAALASAVLSTAAQGLTATQQGNARANIAALGAQDVGAGRLSKSVAGGVDVTLSQAEANAEMIELTGAITANINVIVPAAARTWKLANLTTGAYTLTVKTAVGTGVALVGRTLLECDGTNVLNPLVGAMYGRPNVLGTVSQLAGVPTGAIIERGSNANGEYVRYADGTQICFRYGVTPSFSNSSNLAAAWTFPAQFAVAPVCTANVRSNTLGTSRSITVVGSYATTINDAQVSILSIANFVSGDVTGTLVDSQAVGRWY